MADTDEKYLARAAAAADEFAERFGTPAWLQLLELARGLAHDFQIADAVMLAAVFAEALAKSKWRGNKRFT